MKMSISFEVFLIFRLYFVRFYVLICISYWILGIGDRYLNNFLVSMEIGGVIGIDFGYVFGLVI